MAKEPGQVTGIRCQPRDNFRWHPLASRVEAFVCNAERPLRQTTNRAMAVSIGIQLINFLSPRYKPSLLSRAVLGALLVSASTAVLAQNAGDESPAQPKELDKVVVTGSLIPQSQIETSTPVTVISAEDIQMRGFQSVADILQQSSFATGGVQGGQTSASFTQGAEAASMFGLDPGYTKYLINGRPMANYPALYNGSDVFNNISGIPVALVERIEILPGGQSSLYGSDAIAGVVNIILKKNVDAGELAVRGGFFTEGGGDSIRLTYANSFSGMDGRLNSLVGIQLDDRSPIWGYQRDLSRTYNFAGYNTPVPSRDFLVYEYFTSSYFFMDPNNCANTTGQFNGSTQQYTRPGYGTYCGSFLSPGYRTIRNGKGSGQIYSYTTFDLNDSTQLYAEVMGLVENVKYATGSSYTWWGTGTTWGGYYDPNLDEIVNLQRAFSPEDIGGRGYHDIMNTDKNRALTVTFGVNGQIGEWDYNAYLSRAEYRLTERNWVRFREAIDNYFLEKVLGPQQGRDPYYDYFPVFTPNYDAFYRPIDPTDFARFTGFVNNKSRTWDNLLHFQLTNTALFSLPGGDAGFAVVAEAGNEGWDYSPDARMIEDPDTLLSEIWGQTSVSGAGHRSRYALTSELRLPVLNTLTISASARYDAFDVAGEKVDKPTWSLGFEYRPVESLLLRGKIGTAFRAPSLADTFQGLSGYYSYVADYFRCSEEGYDPSDLEGCAYDDEQFFGQSSGNRDLEPIEADVWNAGVVWSPTAKLSFALDYYSWKIQNEVDSISADDLMRSEYYCRTGAAGMPITSCENVLAWVRRDAGGTLVSLYTPKVNIARQELELITANMNYQLDIGRFGSLEFAANYTNKFRHLLQATPEAEAADLLKSPYWMWYYDSYAKTRLDASLAWAKGNWTTTLYANRIGSTPNYLAYATDSYDYEHSSGQKAGKWAPYITYNASVNWRATDDLTFSVMVNNLTNKTPKEHAQNFPGTTSTPWNNYYYDILGRAIYLEARYNFGN